MPTVGFRVSEGEVRALDEVARRRKLSKSVLLREMAQRLVAEGGGAAGECEVADRPELLVLLTVRARNGNVSAMSRLLEELRRDEAGGVVPAPADAPNVASLAEIRSRLRDARA